MHNKYSNNFKMNHVFTRIKVKSNKFKYVCKANLL